MHGALYYPWLQVAGIDGAPRYVPPSGHVAGIYARSDQAIGVHKAPANERIEATFDLQTDLDDAEIGRLNDGGVNCIRARPGSGVRIRGARTVSQDPAWRDVNVRRVVSTIGRWIERFMTGLVLEPNDVRLWVRIMRELTGYLEGMYQRGALKGSTAEEAFFVKCDDETNPPELQAAGVVVTQIGVAPTVPAEFIVVRIIQGANGVTVNAA
jgi:phage tail sheath protein FI